MLTSLLNKKPAVILALGLFSACGRVGAPMPTEPSDYPRTYPAETTSQINTSCCGGQEGCPNGSQKTTKKKAAPQEEAQQPSCCP